VGKVYASDGADVYPAMQRISEAGFSADAEFSIPEPLAFLPQLHLLLQEYVQGRLAEDFFVTGEDCQCAFAADRDCRHDSGCKDERFNTPACHRERAKNPRVPQIR